MFVFCQYLEGGGYIVFLLSAIYIILHGFLDFRGEGGGRGYSGVVPDLDENIISVSAN